MTLVALINLPNADSKIAEAKVEMTLIRFPDCEIRLRKADTARSPIAATVAGRGSNP